MSSQDLALKLLDLLCAIPAMVMGLTIHEFAHAWTAWQLGDDTPRRAGRITLDPMVHIDPWGAVFFVVAWLSGYGLGWAKPVMINPRNLRDPVRDSVLVAVAGPISNLLQTPFWLAAVYLLGKVAEFRNLDITAPNSPANLIYHVLSYGVVLNVGLAVFNMIPIPPLDGHWVLQALGGPPVKNFFDQIRPMSFWLLLLVINFTPLLNKTVGPVENWAADQAIYVFSLGAGQPGGWSAET